MIEKDIVHLRFLRERSTKGDILTPDDYEFVLKLEDQIQSMQNQICTILSNEKRKEENC